MKKRSEYKKYILLLNKMFHFPGGLVKEHTKTRHCKLHNKHSNYIFLSQGLISRTKDFGDAYELIRSKLASLRDRMVAADALQPDILAKKSQSDQFRVS